MELVKKTKSIDNASVFDLTELLNEFQKFQNKQRLDRSL